MIIEKPTKSIVYKRENIKEFFVVIYGLRNIEEGVMIPRFYLPVKRSEEMHAYECWIFPLAFIVLGWYILSKAFIGIWKDLMSFVRMLDEKNNLIK